MSTDTVIGGLDWDHLPAWMSQLDRGQRSQLLDALRHVQGADHDRAIAQTVRAALAPQSPGREAVAVVFGATEWDNGYFLESSGLVLYADQSTDDVNFGDIDKIFTDEYGVVGSQFGLSVDLPTGAVNTDDYINNLYDALRYSFPGRR